MPPVPTHESYRRVRQQLLDARNENGYWEGHLAASPLATATAVSGLSFYRRTDSARSLQEELTSRIDAGIEWLLHRQNTDGGWGDTRISHSNIATTWLVVAAFHAAGRADEFAGVLRVAQAYIEQEGGIEGLRKRYGQDKTFAVPILANAAMAGLVDWKEVAPLPFEAACVPQRFYRWLQLPVVSYAIPALVAMGQVKFEHDPPRNRLLRFLRRRAIAPSLRQLERIQPDTGGYLEAIPLTAFVAMALIMAGKPEHPVVQNGIRFLIDSFRDEGSWPIDTHLATWNTTLAINALSSVPEAFSKIVASDRERWQRCLMWLLDGQYQQRHPFTGARPGGWGWSHLSGAVPDADDTPGALLAIRNLYDYGGFDPPTRARIVSAAAMGVDWILKLQNRDRGWPTFCRGWGKLPFDRSGSDLTAHAIRGLMAWQSVDTDRGRSLFPRSRMKKAITSGFRYLARTQSADGAWLPLWFGNQDHPDEANPCYGTAKVLLAYRDFDLFDTQEAILGLRWLVDHQHESGGWGGGPSLTWEDDRLGHSSVEETALCVHALANHADPASQAAVRKGCRWLTQVTEQGKIGRYSPIGFYFAKLWYYEALYPLIFATEALGRGQPYS